PRALKKGSRFARCRRCFFLFATGKSQEEQSRSGGIKQLRIKRRPQCSSRHLVFLDKSHGQISVASSCGFQRILPTNLRRSKALYFLHAAVEKEPNFMAYRVDTTVAHPFIQNQFAD